MRLDNNKSIPENSYLPAGSGRLTDMQDIPFPQVQPAYGSPRTAGYLRNLVNYYRRVT